MKGIQKQHRFGVRMIKYNCSKNLLSNCLDFDASCNVGSRFHNVDVWEHKSNLLESVRGWSYVN